MENLTNFCVYMHTNRINGKKYIGITSQKPTNRWQNGHGYCLCPIFYAAIKKYGWDSFQHDILYTGLTQEEAERLEVELIAKYRTQDKAHGYNCASGGRTNAGYRYSEESKRRAREVKLGARNPMWGKTTSEETKAKLRASLQGDKNYRSRAVICVETGQRYAATAEAAREMGVSQTNVSACCRGKRRTAGGYHWRFADEVVSQNG